MSLPQINHTQVSNAFIDGWMRKLSPACTPVFLSIARKTIGWHKASDKISRSQITELTGMSDDVVKAATRELAENNLITVEHLIQGRGNPPSYEINYDILERGGEKTPLPEHSLSGVNGVENPPPSGDKGGGKSPPTKEREYKEKEKRKDIAPIGALVQPSKALIDYYFQSFIRATGQTGIPEDQLSKPVANYAAFTGAVKSAMKSGLTVEDLMKMMALFFRDREMARRGYDPKLFWSNLNKYRLEMAGVTFRKMDDRDAERADRDARILARMEKGGSK